MVLLSRILAAIRLFDRSCSDTDTCSSCVCNVESSISFVAGLGQLVLSSILEMSVSVRSIPSLALDSEFLLKGTLPLLLPPVELM